MLIDKVQSITRWEHEDSSLHVYIKHKGRLLLVESHRFSNSEHIAAIIKRGGTAFVNGHKYSRNIPHI
jgi:hypothetical protein